MEEQGDKRVGAAAAAGKGEEGDRLLPEGAAAVDFDMLCLKVAMQAQKGSWGKLNDDDEFEEGGERAGGVLRMWEGELLYDFFGNRQIAIQSACCPCYRFGKNMKRAGFGPCFLQGCVYLILAIFALLNVLAFVVTKKHRFLYFSVVFSISVGAYLGFFRTQMRRKFNIRDTDTPLDDFVDHLICSCCTLSQESRTLEMNNVEDGIWHGRGDTICIGSYSEVGKAYIQLNPPPSIVSAKHIGP